LPVTGYMDAIAHKIAKARANSRPDRASAFARDRVSSKKKSPATRGALHAIHGLNSVDIDVLRLAEKSVPTTSVITAITIG